VKARRSTTPDGPTHWAAGDGIHPGLDQVQRRDVHDRPKAREPWQIPPVTRCT
jgi:hypothetical protein